jgi:hypothetical protein
MTKGAKSRERILEAVIEAVAWLTFPSPTSARRRE